MRHLSTFWWLLGLCSQTLACSVSESVAESDPNTHSNWLLQCTSVAGCSSGFSCRCGICAKDCETNAQCSSLEDATCVLGTETTGEVLCWREAGASQSGVCLPACEPGTCAADQVCSDGACVPVPVPSTDFCRGAGKLSEAESQLRDDLLSLVQNATVDGGLVCSGMSASEPSPPRRLDPRLFCAAQIFAEDLSITHTDSMTDSEGRSGKERLKLAGYSTATWVGSYAFGMDDAARAFERMRSESRFCHDFATAGFVDVGIGVSGDAFAIVLATE